MRKRAGILAALALVFGAAALLLTAPKDVDPADFSGLAGDAAAGQMVFWAAGCASCHGAENPLTLSGGMAFPSAFGTFYAPNISPDPTAGIGGWTLLQFARAIQRGVGRDGQHLYPALPYGAYAKMTPQDMTDLKAFMDGLPASDLPSKPHDVGFPFNIRRALGLWKLLFLNDDYAISGDLNALQTRGRYIAEALAHCGECHTPRNILGGLQRGKWLSGAPNPDGQGRAPNITPAALSWSADEIAEYLTTGFTPEFDSVGGHMAHVVENMSKLPASDRAAVAAYLARIAPIAP